MALTTYTVTPSNAYGVGTTWTVSISVIGCTVSSSTGTWSNARAITNLSAKCVAAGQGTVTTAVPTAVIQNGQALTISGAAWTSYSNLPSFLLGILGTTNVNDGSTCGSLSSFQFTLSQSTLMYLLRSDSGWCAVDMVSVVMVLIRIVIDAI
jgi:hypothetical protein